ncbi:hypothetical protein BH23GEM3_BH23GEM3_12010 [soil metagenome]
MPGGECANAQLYLAGLARALDLEPPRTRGIKTPKPDMDLFRERLKRAKADYRQRGGNP